MVYPKAGRTWDAASRGWIGSSSLGDYGTMADDWHRGGARWTGGCCGTTPDDIATIRDGIGSLDPGRDHPEVF